MALGNIDKYTPSKFEMVFSKIPTETSILAVKELTINIFGSIIPGMTLDSLDMPFMGGKVREFSGNIEFDPLTVMFNVDSKFRNWYILYSWITFINNNKDKFGENKRLYATDATIRIMDNFENTVLRINFKNIWPNSLTEVSLSYRESESILESMVTFQYDRFEAEEV